MSKLGYGAPLSAQAKKMMLLGAGELGKEVIIEAQRLGIETLAVDRYENAPAMQVAHRSLVVDMLDGDKLREAIEAERPDWIVPEIEAIATGELLKLEEEGFTVIPTARASRLTMDREGIRRLAAETLGLRTANYEFADTLEQFAAAAERIGFPCVVKPIMSSSGKGQSVCRSADDVERCWRYAMEGGRAQNSRVIVEQFIRFDSEITLLTVRSVSGTAFCDPIGHIQQDGDYVESWQPHPMTAAQLAEAQHIAAKVTEALGGRGLYGVELFLTDHGVYFSEVSPRPHDTGMVTLASQELSEFALHVRAVIGLPIPHIRRASAAASAVLKAERAETRFQIEGLERALVVPGSQIRIFGKPETLPGRRMAVALCAADSVEQARSGAKQAAAALTIAYGETAPGGEERA